MNEEAMNEGTLMHGVTTADGTLEIPMSRRSSTDEITFVVVDARGRQTNPLRTTMTVAEALEDSLGPR